MPDLDRPAPIRSKLLDKSPDPSRIVAWLSAPRSRPIPLGPRPVVSIGRIESSDIVLPATEVSLCHAVLKVRGKRISIEDEGSSNGTLVNDRRATTKQLKFGDRIKLGPYEFELVEQEPEVPDDLDEAPEPAAEEAADEPLDTLVLEAPPPTEPMRPTRPFPPAPPSRSAAPPADELPAEAPMVEGDIESTPLRETLRQIESRSLSGQLRVDPGDGTEADLFILNGNPVGASFDPLQGEEAVLAMLALPNGHFEFRCVPVDRPPEMNVTLAQLIREAEVQREYHQGLEGYASWSRNGFTYDDLMDTEGQGTAAQRVSARPDPKPQAPESWEISIEKPQAETPQAEQPKAVEAKAPSRRPPRTGPRPRKRVKPSEAKQPSARDSRPASYADYSDSGDGLDQLDDVPEYGDSPVYDAPETKDEPRPPAAETGYDDEGEDASEPGEEAPAALKSSEQPTRTVPREESGRSRKASESGRTSARGALWAGRTPSESAPAPTPAAEAAPVLDYVPITPSAERPSVARRLAASLVVGVLGAVAGAWYVDRHPLPTWIPGAGGLQAKALDEEVLEALADPRFVAADRARVERLRKELDRLRGWYVHDAALDTSERGVRILEGLLALAEGKPAGAEAALEALGEEDTAGRSALRGGLALLARDPRAEPKSKAKVDRAQVLKDLSAALGGGILRGELRAWRAQTCELNRVEQAQVALNDLTALERLQPLTSIQHARRVTALLTLGRTGEAAKAVARDPWPTEPVRWELTLKRVNELMGLGKPKEARAELRAVEGLAKPPQAKRLALKAFRRARRMLRGLKDKDPQDAQRLEIVEWLALRVALLPKEPLEAEALRPILALLGKSRRPSQTFLAAAPLLEGQPMTRRREFALRMCTAGLARRQSVAGLEYRMVASRLLGTGAGELSTQLQSVRTDKTRIELYLTLALAYEAHGSVRRAYRYIARSNQLSKGRGDIAVHHRRIREARKKARKGKSKRRRSKTRRRRK